LLLVYAMLCAILLLTIFSPVADQAGAIAPSKSTRGNLSVNHTPDAQHSITAGGPRAGLSARTNQHDGSFGHDIDDTEPHHMSSETRIASSELERANPNSLLASRLSLLHQDTGSYAVPDDESRNMGLLANLPRSGTNSDLAFWGNLAIAGNYNGFRVINIANPVSPTVLSTVACRGPQNDFSIWNNLVFLSIDRPQTLTTCSQ